MRDGDTLVFIEVRSRANPCFGGAAASVDRSKQQRLIRSATFLLLTLAKAYWNAGTPRACFDVVAFEHHAPHWLRDAFTLN
jgi:putative endonuclease